MLCELTTGPRTSPEVKYKVNHSRVDITPNAEILIQSHIRRQNRLVLLRELLHPLLAKNLPGLLERLPQLFFDLWRHTPKFNLANPLLPLQFPRLTAFFIKPSRGHQSFQSTLEYTKPSDPAGHPTSRLNPSREFSKIWLTMDGASMLFFFKALQHLDVATASTSLYLVPVFGVIPAAVSLGERMNATPLLGAAIVLISTLLVVRYDKSY